MRLIFPADKSEKREISSPLKLKFQNFSTKFFHKSTTFDFLYIGRVSGISILSAHEKLYLYISGIPIGSTGSILISVPSTIQADSGASIIKLLLSTIISSTIPLDLRLIFSSHPPKPHPFTHTFFKFQKSVLVSSIKLLKLSISLSCEVLFSEVSI